MLGFLPQPILPASANSIVMRCALIGSGSGGNATVVSSGNTHLLVDCGYSTKTFEERSAVLDFDPATLSAVLVTHEHDDHVGGVAALARKYQLPVYCTRGTRVATEAREGPLAWQQISPHHPFTIGDIEVLPIPVPHDAREPSQFIFSHDDQRIGVLTDLGSITPHVIKHYQTCDVLVLEFNHDPALLADSIYPARLKRRIASNYGHLSNAQAQVLLSGMQPRLQRVIAAHLSERTNHPDIVARCLEETLGSLGHVTSMIATQDHVVPWVEVEVR
jgi:phosphoribosyl 1,2-cyclic phosphodiesterase